MNESQLTHLKSMARHVCVHAERLVQEMQSIEGSTIMNMSAIPVQFAAENLTRAVVNAQSEIDSVLHDMLPELEL